MLEVFQYGFMQRAVFTGFLIALVCPVVGVFLVIRRLAMIGDALSHISLTGVAVSLFWGLDPTLGSLSLATFGSIVIEGLRKKFSDYAEISIAIIMSAGMGIAIIFLSLKQSNSANIMSYFFGSIVTITEQELRVIFFSVCFILLAIFFMYQRLFYISFDEEAARLTGMPVKRISYFFTALVGITVAISLRIIGVLLVSAMITIPAAISLQIAKSFKEAMIIAIITAQISVFCGLIISFYFGLASGGAIILVAIFILIFTLLYKNTSYYIINKDKSIQIK